MVFTFLARRADLGLYTLDFSLLRNEIRMRSLVPRERNKYARCIKGMKNVERIKNTKKPN
mgnify:CR=1 FL=1